MNWRAIGIHSGNEDDFSTLQRIYTQCFPESNAAILEKRIFEDISLNDQFCRQIHQSMKMDNFFVPALLKNLKSKDFVNIQECIERAVSIDARSMKTWKDRFCKFDILYLHLKMTHGYQSSAAFSEANYTLPESKQKVYESLEHPFNDEERWMWRSITDDDKVRFVEIQPEKNENDEEEDNFIVPDDNVDAAIKIIRVNEGQGVHDRTSGILIILCAEEVIVPFEEQIVLDEAKNLQEEKSIRPCRIVLIGNGGCQGYESVIEVNEKEMEKFTPKSFKNAIVAAFKQSDNTIPKCIEKFEVKDIENISLLDGGFDGCPVYKYNKKVSVNFFETVIGRFKDSFDDSNDLETSNQLVMKFEILTSAQGDASLVKPVPPTPRIMDHKLVTVHIEQQAVALRILNRVKFALRKSNTDYRSLESFNGLDFAIFVPNLMSLRQQTEARMQATLFADDNQWADLSDKVVPHSHGAVKKLKERIRSALKKRFLFVVISDESHWAQNKGSPPDVLLNDESLKGKENFVVLLVSATPFNNLTWHSRVPEWYVEFEENNPMRPIIAAKTKKEIHKEQRDYEELNVINWKLRNQPLKTPYFRLEDFLRTMPSSILTECVLPQSDGQLTNKSQRQNQLIRGDPELVDIMVNNCTTEKKKAVGSIAREHVWLADVLLSMLYFRRLRWDEATQKLQDRIDTTVSLEAAQKMQLTKEYLKMAADCSGEVRQAAEHFVEKMKDIIQTSESSAPSRCALVEAFFAKLSFESSEGTADSKCVNDSRFFQINETDMMVRDLLLHNRLESGELCGHMKVVRAFSVNLSETIGKGLQKSRDSLFGKKDPPFAVIMDFGTSALYQRIEPHFRNKLIKCSKSSYKPARTLSSVFQERGNAIQYEDLEGLPCILFLIEKGRMGDTFPHSFDCLDMRIRSSDSTTTLIQELGRLSRYARMQGESPFSCSKRALEIAKERNWFKRARKPIAVYATLDEAKEGKVAVGAGERLVGMAWDLNSWTRSSILQIVGKGKLLEPQGRNSNLDVYKVQVLREGGGQEVPNLVGCWLIRFPRIMMLDRKRRSQFPWPDLQCLEIIEHDSNKELIKVRDKSKTKHTDFGPESYFTIVRDCGSLEWLTSETNCPYGGVMKELEHDLPCALVMNNLYESIEKAVDVAEISGREIWECIKLDSKLHKHMKRRKANQDLKISYKENELHDYRRQHDAVHPQNNGTTGNNDHCDWCEDPDVRGRHALRFLLHAECQIGKTGAYLCFLSRLREEIGISPDNDFACLPLMTNSVISDARFQSEKSWKMPYWEYLAGEDFDPLNLKQGKYHKFFIMQRLKLLTDCTSSDSSPSSADWPPWKKGYWEGLMAAQSKDRKQGECLQVTAKIRKLEENLRNMKECPIKVEKRKEGIQVEISDVKGLTQIVAWDMKPSEQTPILSRVKDEGIRSRYGQILLERKQDGNLFFPAETDKLDPQQIAWKIASTEAEEIEESGASVSKQNSQKAGHEFAAKCLRSFTFLEKDKQILNLSDKMRGFELNKLFGDSSNWPVVSTPSKQEAIKYFKVEGNRILGGAVELEQRGSIRHYWVFTPSFGRDSNSCRETGRHAFLDRSKAFKDGEGDLAVRQILVVRPDEEPGEGQFSAYRNEVGSELVVVSLPRKMQLSKDVKDIGFRTEQFKNQLKEGKLVVTPDDGGVGYARLFIQIFAHLLGLEKVWMIDDNVLDCYEMDLKAMFEKTPPTHQPLLPCSFAKIMRSIEDMFDNAQTDFSCDDVSSDLRPCPSFPSFFPSRMDPGAGTSCRAVRGKCANKTEGTTISCVGDFRGDFEGYAVVGMRRDPYRLMTVKKPFQVTHSVYSFFLLNVRSTIAKGVLFPPKRIWEDVDFNALCEEQGLAVLKVNRFFHCKPHLSFFDRLKAQDGRRVEIFVNGVHVCNYTSREESASCLDVWKCLHEWVGPLQAKNCLIAKIACRIWGEEKVFKPNDKFELEHWEHADSVCDRFCINVLLWWGQPVDITLADNQQSSELRKADPLLIDCVDCLKATLVVFYPHRKGIDHEDPKTRPLFLDQEDSWKFIHDSWDPVEKGDSKSICVIWDYMESSNEIFTLLKKLPEASDLREIKFIMPAAMYKSNTRIEVQMENLNVGRQKFQVDGRWTTCLTENSDFQARQTSESAIGPLEMILQPVKQLHKQEIVVISCSAKSTEGARERQEEDRPEDRKGQQKFGDALSGELAEADGMSSLRETNGIEATDGMAQDQQTPSKASNGSTTHGGARKRKNQSGGKESQAEGPQTPSENPDQKPNHQSSGSPSSKKPKQVMLVMLVMVMVMVMMMVMMEKMMEAGRTIRQTQGIGAESVKKWKELVEQGYIEIGSKLKYEPEENVLPKEQGNAPKEVGNKNEDRRKDKRKREAVVVEGGKIQEGDVLFDDPLEFISEKKDIDIAVKRKLRSVYLFKPDGSAYTTNTNGKDGRLHDLLKSEKRKKI